jgi:hypothetical protein
MTYNLIFLLTGDPGREMFDPDLLGEMVKLERGRNLLDQIFNLMPDIYGRFMQVNTSAGQYATLLGEVSLMLLDQVTLRTSL